MSERKANCPSCGAEIGFRPGTFVSVCPFCSSVVARTDRNLELLGKASAVVDTNSPLELSAEGVYQSSHFALAGHTQLSHPAGGVWDEWYLAFDDGRWGWLAEAQGHFYLTFRKENPGQLPAEWQCSPGAELDLGGGRWVVSEVGEATVVTAEGELPYAFQPNETYKYVDVAGIKKTFATLDYSESPPILFVGREVSLADLKVQPRAGYSSKPAIQAASLACPHCGGPLTLRVPDQTQRVTCPSCDSLLDTSRGQLKYLETLPHSREKIYIPPGTEGTFEGIKYTAIGWMRRSCEVDHVTYSWDEYLLYNVEIGFRWLMESDGHWNFISPLGAADVMNTGMSAIFGGRSFRKFQEVQAVVDAVKGEFYWQVEVGERVLAADFVNPPEVLSLEASLANRRKGTGSSEEINWSLGKYVDGRQVWEAFKLKDSPPSPSGIAPNQPSPYDRYMRQILPLCGVFLAALAGLYIFAQLNNHDAQVFKDSYRLPFTPDDKGEQVAFSQPFDIPDGRHNIQVRVSSDVSNSWLFLSGALVSEETGAVETFNIENSYYFGSDGGESWSEGSPRATVYLSHLPAGKYMLRLEPQWDTTKPPATFDVTVKVGVVRELYYLIAFALIAIGPLLLYLGRAAWENKRWQESMYSEGSE